LSTGQATRDADEQNFAGVLGDSLSLQLGEFFLIRTMRETLGELEGAVFDFSYDQIDLPPYKAPVGCGIL
jgi:hypothetical protein